MKLSKDPAQVIAAIAERRKNISPQKSPNPINAPSSPVPVQLDFWEDGKRAAPNAIFRSALFPAIHPKQKENRKFIEEKIILCCGFDGFFHWQAI